MKVAWRLAWRIEAACVLAVLGATPSVAQQTAVPVSTATATRMDVPIYERGIGTVQPFQSVLIRARVDGTIVQIAFMEGQTVKPGDFLALIDPRPYQATLDQALAKKTSDVAQLSNVRKDLTRYSDLARSDFASRQSVDTQAMSVSQMSATVDGDDATIAAAKLNLDFTRITSPIEGRVGLRLVDTGNLVHASDTSGIVVVNQIRPIAALFTLPQDDFHLVQDAIRSAGSAPLTVIAFTGDDKHSLATGTLLTVDNAIDTSTGTIRLKAIFPNADDRLWPGQFVNAHLQMSIQRSAVTVPSAAIQHGADGLYVYLVKPGGVAGVQPVQIGQDDGAVAVVTAGLGGGELVVTGGQSRLTTGTLVVTASTSATTPSNAAPQKVGG